MLDQTVRLERDVGGARIVVLRLEHEVGAGEGGVGLPEGLLHRAQHVALLPRLVVDGALARVEGVLGGEDGRQGLVHDPDQARGVPRDLLGHRGHAGHRLAHVADLADGEGGLVLHHRDGAVAHREGLPRHHREDPRQRQSRPRVEREDAGVGVRGAQDLGVGEARELDVCGVTCAPVYSTPAVDAAPPAAAHHAALGGLGGVGVVGPHEAGGVAHHGRLTRRRRGTASRSDHRRVNAGGPL